MGSPNYNFELPDPPPFATKPIPVASDSKKVLRLQKINLLTSLLLVTGFLISCYALGFICGSLQRIEEKLNALPASNTSISNGAPGSTVDNIANDLEQTRQILQQAEQMFSPVEENKK